MYPWHIISRLNGRYLYTLQVRSSDSFSSSGYLAVTDLKTLKTRQTPGRNVPSMQGSRVVNDLTSFDPGRKSRTLLIMNSYSVAGNSEFYRQYYKDRGWKTMVDLAGDNGRTLVFSKFDRETHLVISRRSETTRIVMNILTGK
jgi:hypothetical protein